MYADHIDSQEKIGMGMEISNLVVMHIGQNQVNLLAPDAMQKAL